MLRVTRALVRHATPQGRRWVSFSDPIEHFVADDLASVGAAIDAAEAAAAAGRWVVGFVSYDAGPAFDPAIASHRADDTPLVAMASFAEARPSRGPAGRLFETGDWVPSDDQAAFESSVREIRERIAAGDTYQVNYTMRLDTQFAGDPEGLFAALCRAQRADHLAFIDLGDAAVCSASPELFVRRIGRTVETRPMKGTRPRHPDPIRDRDLAEELVRSEKDRAENTMIVDMARNDLGRIADVGSVRTVALHTVESYPTVHQLTSTVVAETDASLRELFAATFPGASITGAPKVATSRIITELESRPRGTYTGSVGLIEPGGDAEFNIAIRTAWVDQRTGTATYGVGGGIVWDSDETAEWEEAHDKARVLYRATRPFRLLETLGWDPGAGPILLDRHVARLAASAAHFGFDCDVAEITRRLGAVRAEEPKRLRLLVAADGAIEVQVLDMPPRRTDAWQLAIDTLPVGRGDEFLRHKTTRRDRYEEAAGRFPDADDVVLWNEDGEITETSVANLVLEIDGEALTPAESSGLLPGTLRAELLANGRIREAVLTLDDLHRADRIWGINSLRGWIPAELRHRGQSPVPPSVPPAASRSVEGGTGL
ncbi:MAG: aminodeoxychorismate synthase component I [Acidimicrobiales bacterium]|nr:aminodeoxychorismate synthase component I [Acidimicrobiales bacterium]